MATNDDAVKSVQIITDLFAEAIKIAKEIHLKRVAEERDAAEAAKKVAQENAEEAEAKAEKPARKPRAKAADKGDKPARKPRAKAEAPAAE